MKSGLIFCLFILFTSCSWLTSNAQVEEDLMELGKDSVKTVEDVVKTEVKP